MTWLEFCEFFTICNLVLLGFGLIVLLLIGIAKFIIYLGTLGEVCDANSNKIERLERWCQDLYNQNLKKELRKITHKKGSK